MKLIIIILIVLKLTVIILIVLKLTVIILIVLKLTVIILIVLKLTVMNLIIMRLTKVKMIPFSILIGIYLNLSTIFNFPLLNFQPTVISMIFLSLIIVLVSIKSFKKVITEVFNPAVLFPHIDELKLLIRSYVKKDKSPQADGTYPKDYGTRENLSIP